MRPTSGTWAMAFGVRPRTIGLLLGAPDRCPDRAGVRPGSVNGSTAAVRGWRARGSGSPSSPARKLVSDTRCARQPYRLADLPHAGRVAAAPRQVLDDLDDVALTRSEIPAVRSGRSVRRVIRPPASVAVLTMTLPVHRHVSNVSSNTLSVAAQLPLSRAFPQPAVAARPGASSRRRCPPGDRARSPARARRLARRNRRGPCRCRCRWPGQIRRLRRRAGRPPGSGRAWRLTGGQAEPRAFR